jgi:hypothetical protein
VNSKRGLELDRAEALRVLQEILKACKEEIMNATSISIDETTSPSNYTVKITSSLDDCSRNQINSILDKHKLVMKESEDSIVIHSI